MSRPCRKLPPTTTESMGVATACGHPSWKTKPQINAKCPEGHKQRTLGQILQNSLTSLAQKDMTTEQPVCKFENRPQLFVTSAQTLRGSCGSCTSSMAACSIQHINKQLHKPPERGLQFSPARVSGISSGNTFKSRSKIGQDGNKKALPQACYWSIRAHQMESASYTQLSALHAPSRPQGPHRMWRAVIKTRQELTNTGW